MKNTPIDNGHDSAKRPSAGQRLLSTWFRRPATWSLSLLAVTLFVASGASAVLRQLPRQLNPVIFITSGLEKALGHRSEVTKGQPVFASTIPGTVAPTQTISGTLYDSAGSPITSAHTIRLLQNGTSFGTAITNGSGSYGFTGVTLASGDKIVVFISGAAEKGATVTLAGTLDITNLNIRANSLIVRTDNGGPITNANLKDAEGGSPDADLTAVRMLDGANVLTLPAGFNLQIWPGSTFAPGANIQDAGSWTNNGAFVPGAHSVTFNGDSNQTINGSSSTTFYELTISNTGTSPANRVTLDGSAGATNTVVSKLNINSGVFDQGTGSAASELSVDGGAGTFTTCVFVQPGGHWENFGWQDVILWCDVSNQGTIEFNSNGTACGQPDDILVRSNVTGIQRTWAGPGTFSMTDVNVRDQRVPGGLSLPEEIDVNSGTNAGNNNGWIFSNVCGSYTWVGAFGQDWANPYNWSPVRYTASNPFTSDVLIFNGNVTTSPLVNSITQTNAAIQLKNGVALTLDPIGGGTLTLNGGTGSDLDVPAGTLLKFEGFNDLIISLTGPGHQCDVGGQIIMQGSAHKLLGANPGEITMSGPNAFTTQSGFIGNPFGTSPNGAVVFLSGSRGNFNAGADPFGGPHSVVTFNSGSTARFGAPSAFSSSLRTYGNLILGGNQNYPPLLGGQTTVQNNFVLEADTTWTLSGDLNLLGNFEDQSLGAGTFDVNSRTVKFQGGSATQTIFKPGTNPLNFGDVFVAKTAGGKVQLLSSVNINGQLNLSTADSQLELNQKTLTLNGTVTGPGNLKGDGAATLNIGGIGPLGTLKFLSGFQTLSQLKMDRALPTGSVTLGNDLTVGNTLSLTNGVVNMGSFTLTANGAVNRFDGYIIGNEQRFITCANTCPALTFDVGTLNGYSPVNSFLHVGAISGTYNQTIKAIQGQHPSIHGAGVNALQRYWTLSSVTGPSFSHADLTFNYLAGDVVGTPASYVFFKNSAGAWSQAAPAAAPTSTSASINGVNSFSDWTLAQAAAVTPGNLQFSAANYDNAEQNSLTHTATITVRRVGGIDGAVSVHWSTSAGTATPGSDYTESFGDLNWADGDAADKTFTVTVSGDTDYEFDETVNLTLSAPTGLAGLGTPNPATLTITNDDTADTDVALLGGTLEIIDANGANTDDTITISLNGSNVRVTDPNHTLKCGMGATVIDVHTCDVPLISITGSIHVNALAGNDSLTLALANGNFFPPGGVTYNGGDQTTVPGDKLFITGGSQGTVTYHYTNPHDGTIAMTNFGTVTYTGLEPISNSGASTDIIFELPPGPSAVTLADDGAVGNMMSRLSGTTFETTDVANPTVSLEIKRGNAADIVAVNALPDFTASLAIGSVGNEFGTITFNGAITLATDKILTANASSAINLSNGANTLTTSGAGTISFTAANVTGAGNVSTGGGLTISNTGSSSTLSGVIAGTGGLTKLGAGTLNLAGANTYTGATAVNFGRLNINGSINSNTTVDLGATLGGTGTINSANTLTVNGVLAPGTSPGILNTGNVTLNSSSSFAVEIGGTLPGNSPTNHDQLNATGTVSLGNAVLSLSSFNGFTPTALDTFVIINNDDTDAISGTFLGLLEGATITNFLNSGLNAKITYIGGSGNDVVLTAEAPPPAQPGNLQFSLANYDNTEDSITHTATITVRRVGGSDGAVSVHWATSPGTATPGVTSPSDYTENQGDLSWIPGNADDQTFTVTVIGDTTYELNETVNLTLSAPTGGAGLGTPNAATLTIINDDVADSEVVLLSGGILQITDINGGNTDDTFTISLNGANVRVTDPNHTLICGTDTTAIDAHTCEVPLLSITGSILVNALAGNDSLTLALGGGNFFPTSAGVGAGVLTYNGGDQTTVPGDKLFITGGSQGTVTYHYTNVNDGSIVMSNVGTVNYTGLEPISNTGTATNVIFELPPGPTNPATLADDGISNTMSRLSGTTFETTDFSNPTASLMIKRGNAADTVALSALPDLTASLAIGSAGNEFSNITFNGVITLATNNSLAASASTIDLSNGSNALTTSGTGAISLTAANVNGAGNISTGGGLTISNTGSSSTLSGVIAGPGGLTKLGAGTLVLSGTNTYVGATLINGGRLNVNGLIASDTTVNPTGTLGGTGTINSANTVTVSGGTVAPGTSPGILNTGNVSFDSSSSYAVEIGGITPGTNHDQLNVTGTVSLGNATLNLSPLSFTPSAGQTFVIINNDGSDLTTGNFTLGTGGTDANGGSLAEGDTISNFLGSTLKATITYQGGPNNNDVVLTAADPVRGNLQFSAANYDDPEDSITHTATITVQRVGGVDGAVAVHWATSAGTATPGSDYTQSAGDLNWADGNADPKTFTVTVIGDTAYEFNETVNLTLSLPTGGAGLGTPNPATLTIINDDVADSDVSILGGNLQVTDVNGGNTPDTFTISLNGANIRVTDPNHTLNCGAGATVIDVNTCEVPLASILAGSIQVNALAGNDSLTLALANGNFFPPDGVIYNGGDPTTGPGDKLFITGGSQGTVTYHYTNAHDGTVTMSTFGTVSYTGLEPISNTGTAADIIFELPPGPNAATLADDGIVGNTMLRLSGATFETTDFTNPTASLTVKRGNAADTIEVNALPDFNASLAIGSFSDITFSGAITLATNKSLAAGASNAINLANGANGLTTSGTGTISLTAADVTGAGYLGTGGGLTINNTGSDSTLSGVIAGTGGLTKLGAGTLALLGTNTYTGATAVNAGRLNIDGFIASNTTVNTGATLGGRGTIDSTKTLTVNDGVGAPGTSPGIFNTGNVTLNSTSNFAVEIGGILPGNLATNHDQLKVTGTVSLGNAVLSQALFNGFTPTVGQTFVIIDNDGTADPVNGTFNGLPQGASIPNFLGSALKATISYTGGDGNDVVLTAAAPVSGNLQFSQADYPDMELNSGPPHPVTIAVQRVGGIDGAVSVHWATSAGTATPGSDYSESTGDLNWAAGDATDKTFTVMVSEDTVYELNETVILTLSAPTGGAGVGTPNPATLTITNDDTADTDIVLSGSNLQITDANGGSSDDMLTISRNGANVRINDPNHTLNCVAGTAMDAHTCEVPFTLIATGGIQVNTLGGNDSLTLALAGGNFFPAGGLTYNGGAQTTSDKLFITGGSNQGKVTYRYTNANDGSVEMANFGTVTYTGLEPISNTGTATDVIFELPPGPTNPATLEDDGTVGNTMSRLSGATFETTDFANPTASLTIKRGNAADTIAVNVLPDFDVNLAVGEDVNPFATITVNGTVAVAGGAAISLNGGDVTGGGNLSTGLGLTVNNTGTSSTLTGVIGGTGGLTKLGAGTLVLSGTNTYGGVTAINGGRLNINGLIASDTTVNATGTLGGTGTINSANSLTVNTDGVVAPGTSPGILNTGSVTFNSGSILDVEIGGTLPGNTATDHDQLHVSSSGTVSLGGATLNLASFGGFSPVAGQGFVILSNDGAGAITGNFTMGAGGADANGGSLAEGDTITNFLGSSLNATITYTGGDGNDVRLTVTIACPTITLSPASLPDGATGHAYTTSITADGGLAPYTFVAAGPVPNGLTLNSDGTWLGTATAVGTYSFTVTATDSNGCTGSQPYTIVIKDCSVTPFTVNSLDDNDDLDPDDGLCKDSLGNCTLRAAIQQANKTPAACGTIDIGFSVTGTILLANALDPIQHNVNINNSAGASALTVDGQEVNRIFAVDPGYTVSISGLTLTRGFDVEGVGEGAALLNEGGTVTVNDCIFTDNTSSNGGAIYTDGGFLTLNNCVVEGNIADGDGGGLYNFGSTVTLNNSRFDSNDSNIDGGGIFNCGGGTLFMGATTVSGNFASDTGAGIFNETGTTAEISDSTISSNDADDGGGIFNGGTLKLTNSTISGNTAISNGGGLYNDTNSEFTFTNVTVTDNHCDDDDDDFGDGGGIFADSGLTNSQRLLNTIVSGNFRGSIFGAPVPNNIAGGGIVTGSFNLIGTGSGGLDNSAPNQDNILNQDNPKLAPLGSYGGLTETHALLIGSPAIDKGNNCVTDGTCAAPHDSLQLAYDQRGLGFPRKINGAGSLTVDIGAFESPDGAGAGMPGPDSVVNTKDDHDDGACEALSAGHDCTLREAIIAANVSPDANIIKFDIPSSGVQTISVKTNLPPSIYPVTIDGFTQKPCSSNAAPCSQPNNDPDCNDAQILIELEGSLDLDCRGIGLRIAGGSSTIRGFVINRFLGCNFDGTGILLSGNGGNTIVGNFIGTDVTGLNAVDDSFEPIGNDIGIQIVDCANNLIGGPVTDTASAAARNLISANGDDGIQIMGVNSTRNIIRGNFIGTDASGEQIFDLDGNFMGNLVGVSIYDGANNVIGNSELATALSPPIPAVNGAGNVISGNIYLGVETTSGIVAGPAGNGIGSNFIGTDLTGTLVLGNLFGDGVQLCLDSHNNLVGGSTPAFANIIANNGDNGVNLLASALNGNTIRLNSIYNNYSLGIDINDDDVTRNDPGDIDTGPNELQNFPVITTATSTNGALAMTGSLNSIPDKTFTIDFYANQDCNDDQPSNQGHGEGQTYLGSLTNVTTNGSGDATWIFTGVLPPGAGSIITATATSAAGSTSEFSQCFPATVLNTVLSVSKSSPSPSLQVGQPSTYTITVTNNGNLATSSATVKEAIPNGLDLDSATGTNWSCTPASQAGPSVGTITCTFSGGTIAAAGGTSTISITVRPETGTAGSSVTNYYSVDPSGSTNPPDPTTCDGADSPTAGCGAPVGPDTIAAPPTADLSITKSDSPDPVTEGNLLTYTITVLNNGPDGATNVAVLDTIPANTTFQSSTASQGSCSGTTTVTCNLGALSAAGSATVTIVVTPTHAAAGTTISNTATATAVELDPTTSNNSATEDTQVSNDCPPSFLVNSAADTNDLDPNDRACLDTSGQCTLRAAVQQANALTACGPIEIDFAIGSATITLTNPAGELSIQHDVNIVGPTVVSGNSIVIDGNHASRIFSVNPAKTVSISNLNLTRGNGSGDDGGAIKNLGSLTLNGVTLSANAAVNGGAIRSDGTLVLINTTISGNTATGNGGGLYNTIAQATLTNVTIAYNHSNYDDSAPGSGGGIFVASGNVLLHNTIVADNYQGSASTTADNIGGTVDPASSYNLIGVGAGGLSNGVDHNQVGVATALLGALMNNGGPTLTHGLLYNSPALEAGDGSVVNPPLSINVDQRGLSRPADGDLTAGALVDIGAYERQPAETRPAGFGSDVKVDINDVRLRFPCVGGCGGAGNKGDTANRPEFEGNTVTLTDVAVPVDAPPGSGPAFDVTPSSNFYGSPATSVLVCFYLPSVTDPTAFGSLKILHREGGVLMDNGSVKNPANKTVCTEVHSFSEFVIAQGVGPTATDATVSGQILDNQGNPVEGAAVRMNGTQSRLTITDAAGRYHFDDVATNGLYVVTPSRANFNFSPSQRSFSQLGAHTEATFTASANAGALNPLDTTEYFVRQQYLDFLGREPDEAGFNFWINNIESCGNDAGCREVKRIDTSAAFFLSIEFQQTGYVVYRTYQTAFGDLPSAPVPLQLTEFRNDAAQISNGVVVLQNGWQRTLDNNKKLFAEDFVKRGRFSNLYPASMTPAEFVDKLFATAQLPLTGDDHAAAIAEFGRANDTSDLAARARALRRVAEGSDLTRREFNQAFVLMEYFGYLRRDPNSGQDPDFSGYNFWLDKLERFGGNFENAEMVKAFLVSAEYRRRFPH